MAKSSCGDCGSGAVTITSGCGQPVVPTNSVRVVTQVCTPKVKCAGRTPFMIPIKCNRVYPAGTVGYDECGYWFTPVEEAFLPPKGNWRPLDLNAIFRKLYLLQHSCCDFIFPPMQATSSCTAPTGVCESGQQAKLWCENEVGCYQGKLFVSTKENNIWTGAVTDGWIGGMCVGEMLKNLYVLIQNAGTAPINYNSAAMRPSAWVRSGNYPKISGLKPPSHGVIRDELYGGFKYDADGSLVVPKTGLYAAEFLTASIADATKLYVAPFDLKASMLVNGVSVTARNHDDHTGNHSGEENPRPRPLNIPLRAGDKVTVLTDNETDSNYLATYDIVLNFQHDLP